MAAEDDWWQLLTCTHDFEAELSSELSVKAEEQVRIVATGGDGWVVVSNSSGRSGLVPLAYLQRSSEYIKRNGMDEALVRSSRFQPAVEVAGRGPSWGRDGRATLTARSRGEKRWCRSVLGVLMRSRAGAGAR